jgi:hypothetical protein
MFLLTLSVTAAVVTADLPVMREEVLGSNLGLDRISSLRFFVVLYNLSRTFSD